MHTLEGRVEAQQAKIEALEFFFRKVNNRDEDCSVTSVTSFSSSGSFGRDRHSATAAANGGAADDSHNYGSDQDEAWELEGGAPKLSWSFRKTTKKVNYAKIRAAKKMAQITCV